MNKIKSITRGQLLLFIFVLLVIGGTILGLNLASNKSYEQYGEFEDELKENAKTFVELNEIEVDRGGEKVIKLSTLNKQDITSNELKDKCTGYVIVANDDLTSDEYSYTAYIKCGNKYTTSGYVIGEE